MKNKIRFIMEMLRVKQWVKNIFIFFPLLFSRKLFDSHELINCVITFLGFCLLSSGVYILNDFRDRHQDRLHPQKAHRPFAQNEPKIWLVCFLVVFFLGLGVLICSLVSPLVSAIGIFYILLHLSYNFFTKSIVLLDVIFVAMGFQVRIWAGSFASDVFPSVWLQMCVFLLALFLGFTKRRHEISSLGDKATQHRGVLAHYTAYLLDQIIIICSTLAIVFYGLYTITPEISYSIHGRHMIYSVVFVIYGIFRYLYLIHVKNQGGDPGEILATDAPSLINVLLWILYITFLLYNPIL